jgi:hypothetical protein
MFSSSLLWVVLAGATTAFTPAGFEPASANNLTVVFGNTLATNGKNILKVGKNSLQCSPDLPNQSRNGSTSNNWHTAEAGGDVYNHDGGS